MALGQIGKPNLNLLDTLKELNDLVKSLHGKEFLDAIDELKVKTNAYNEAKSKNEPLIHTLNDATRENEKSLAELKAERNALSSAKHDHERLLLKIKAAQSAVDASVDASKLELEKRIAISESEVAEKSSKVTVREIKANEKQKQADALITEYQLKLTELKKITG